MLSHLENDILEMIFLILERQAQEGERREGTSELQLYKIRQKKLTM